MSVSTERSTTLPGPVSLKNPIKAGLLTWLLPGWGHWHQGRYPKAILFFCTVVPLFLFGCYLGSDPEYGVARNVYCQFSLRLEDNRLFFIPQACLGMAAIPAVLQAATDGNGSSLFGKIMAPPQRFQGDTEGTPPTFDDIVRRLNNSFDIGTVFTVVAGLMNLLVIFDAMAGPMTYPDPEEKKKTKGGEKSVEEGEQAVTS